MSPSPTQPRPPSHLSRASRAWWTRIVTTWVIDDHMLRVLEMAASAYDRAEQARGILEQEGLFQLDRYGNRRPNPAVAIERDSRLAAARLIRELGLAEGATESRPARIAGRYR